MMLLHWQWHRTPPEVSENLQMLILGHNQPNQYSVTWHNYNVVYATGPEIRRALHSCPTNVAIPLLEQIIEVVATNLYESSHARSRCLSNETRYTAITGLPLAYHCASLSSCLLNSLKLAPQPPSAYSLPGL